MFMVGHASPLVIIRNSIYIHPHVSQYFYRMFVFFINPIRFLLSTKDDWA